MSRVTDRITLGSLSAYSFGSIVSGAGTMLSVFLFVRLLTPSDFGAITLWNGATTTIVAVSAQWLRQAALRYTVEYDLEVAGRLESSLGVLIALTCAFVGVAGALACDLLPAAVPLNISLVAAGVVSICLQVYLVVELAIWQARFQAGKFALLK